MYIDDDADADTVATEVVAAIKESARHIGKIGLSFQAAQFQEIEAAIEQLQNMINLKRKMNNS